MARQKSEKELAKKLAPSWHKHTQDKALKEVKVLLEHIKKEPLPNDAAVEKENKLMRKEEQSLAAMLAPLDKVISQISKQKSARSPLSKPKTTPKKKVAKRTTKKATKSKSRAKKARK